MIVILQLSRAISTNNQKDFKWVGSSSQPRAFKVQSVLETFDFHAMKAGHAATPFVRGFGGCLKHGFAGRCRAAIQKPARPSSARYLWPWKQMLLQQVPVLNLLSDHEHEGTCSGLTIFDRHA